MPLSSRQDIIIKYMTRTLANQNHSNTLIALEFFNADSNH